MSYSQEQGYTPISFEATIGLIREEINTQFGTSYTEDTFLGTGFYKFAYAITQLVQANQIKLSEVFQKLQEYIPTTNEMIQRPSVSLPGLIDSFTDAEYVASVKPPVEADAGLLNICVDVPDSLAGVQASGTVEVTSYANLVSGTDDSVTVGATVFTAQTGAVTPGATTFRAATSNDATALSLASQINAHATAGALVTARASGAVVTIKAIARGTAGNSIALTYIDNDANVGATVSDTTLLGGLAADADYADTRLAICTLIKDFVAAGIVTQGSESESITITNGQSFDFKFRLPNRIPILLRITLVTSENNLLTIPDDEDIRQLVFDNVNARYRLGYNFEPQRYFTLSDALWAGSCLLEWSDDDGDTWHDEIYDSLFDELFTFDLEDIDVDIS